MNFKLNLEFEPPPPRAASAAGVPGTCDSFARLVVAERARLDPLDLAVHEQVTKDAAGELAAGMCYGMPYA